jgi:hypothetical protein
VVLRYLLILALLYVLYRLVKASLRGFIVNLNRGRQSGYSNGEVHRGKKSDLDSIEDAKYEEIKDDPPGKDT